MAQEIFPRTYSGTKDAALSGVQDNNGNLYVVGCNGSMFPNVRSTQEPYPPITGFNETSGVFVTKLDKYGNTIWYTQLANNYGFGKGKLLISGNFVYASFKNVFYKLNKNTGVLSTSYSPPGESILDFELRTQGANTYAIALLNNGTDYKVKVVRVNPGIFTEMNEIEFSTNNITADGKIISRGNNVYVGLHNYLDNPGTSGTITYAGTTPNTINLDPNRYTLFQYNLTMSGSFPLTFQNGLNLGTSEDYTINDFDVEKDPTLGVDLVYTTGKDDDNNEIYTFYATSFNEENTYEVHTGDKNAFNVYNGKVYYAINANAKIYGGIIENGEAELQRGWDLNTNCFSPLFIIPSINTELFPIGYYTGSCTLGNHDLDPYPIVINEGTEIEQTVIGAKTIITKIDESNPEFTRTWIANNNPEIILYPNPATTEINFQTNEDVIGIVKIYDTNQNLVINTQNYRQLNTQKIDIKTLPKGFYYLIITLENGYELRKQLIVK